MSYLGTHRKLNHYSNARRLCSKVVRSPANPGNNGHSKPHYDNLQTENFEHPKFCRIVSAHSGKRTTWFVVAISYAPLKPLQKADPPADFSAKIDLLLKNQASMMEENRQIKERLRLVEQAGTERSPSMPHPSERRKRNPRSLVGNAPSVRRRGCIPTNGIGCGYLPHQRGIPTRRHQQATTKEQNRTNYVLESFANTG